MKFRSEFFPKVFNNKIKHTDKIMLIGSCFTEQIGNRLQSHKFTTLQNPNGILFNPVSISKAIETYINKKQFKKEDLFYDNELYGSWLHHTQFSAINENEVLSKINISQNNASEFLAKADWLILTLGSSFIYERKNEYQNNYNNVVANCHKIPADKFNRRLLGSEEISVLLKSMIEELKEFNPDLNIIFTISPVRHLREGFVENNQSKAALIEGVHSVINDENILYFPSYELVIDDLRDYRFFAEDLVHPNYAATNYIWEKFIPVCIESGSQKIIEEIKEINTAFAHKPFNNESNAHKMFLDKYYNITLDLKNRFPYLDFQTELDYFSGKI